MKNVITAIAAGSLIVLANQALAQDASTPWLVRARVVNIDPANKSDPVGGVGASDLITVSKKTIPEVDISYFLSSNVAMELVLTYPQKHDVSLAGSKIGSFKHLPPTLLAQYHFGGSGAQIDPYVGAGVNFTAITKVDLLGGAAGLEHKSVGPAIQAGIDFKIDKKWSVNLDVKKVQIRSDVFLSGAKVSSVKVDPTLIGVGIGYRF